jgi:threonine/homoserine/homoserine lactone efflux protein
VFGAIALSAGALGAFIKRSPAAQIWLNRISALVFVALALKLVTAQR